MNVQLNRSISGTGHRVLDFLPIASEPPLRLQFFAAACGDQIIFILRTNSEVNIF